MIDRVKRRIRKARQLPPGVRFQHLTEPLYRRLPTPYVVATARRLGLPTRDLVRYFREARKAPITGEVIERGVITEASGHIGLVPAAFLYALVRTVRPGVMIETGVASGLSSAFILAALRANGRGRLISIDLPFGEVAGEPEPIIAGTSITRDQWSPVPAGRRHGWLIPDELRADWDLRAGDAKELLPAALEEVGEIEIFLHDSLHTPEHMLFEYETAWPHIAPGGVLASDDLGRKQDPMHRFSRAVGVPFTVQGGMGFMRKPAA